MNKKIIIVEGYLASGKSTFTRSLSKEINVPYLIKDTFKIALCDNFPITNREDSSRFSAVTFDGMMYVTERLMEVGYPIIIEGNFVPPDMKKVDEAGVIKALIDKYTYQSLTYKFMGDTKVLYERYIERDKLPERGDANRDFEEVPYERFSQYCYNLDKFSVGGEVIKVDTTDFSKVNFVEHIERARLFNQIL
jgi:deoxyadenosine/deoxycytidine kinase